ncbi:MAG: tetratricopeptide repeat protein [Candidatus Latescibacteria bacterium]|nr:tetratricopeptide repeat protein [Candidatus Latescibacterota bacterium]
MTTAWPASGRGGRIALALGLAGLLLRLWYIGEIDSSPLFAVPVVDARTYVEDARYLGEESWAGRPEPFWQPPLYPYFLALLFSIFGEGYYVPRLLQALLGGAICALIYLIGHRVFPPAVALGAGLAAVVYGPLIYFGGELLPTLLAVFLDLLLLFVLVRWPPGAGRWPWLGIGLLLGLSALAVANILLFLPFLIGWLWRYQRAAQMPVGQVGQQIALLVVGVLLCIAPVTARNYWVGGEWVLISHNAGINFYLGNNPDYDRTVGIRPGREWAELVEMPRVEAGIEGAAEKSRYFFSRAWNSIVADPVAYGGLLARKVYLFWHGNEILRNLDPYYSRADSSLLGVLLWKYGLAFPFGVVAPLALMGLALWLFQGGRSREEWLLVLFAGVYMLSVVLFFVTARYRLPVVPLLLLFAGYGVRALWARRRRLGYWAAFAVLALAANLGAGPMDMEGEAQQHFWLGYAYLQQDMPTHAKRQYRQVLEMEPRHENARLGLATLYTQRGEYDQAAEQYRTFLEYYPEASPVRFLLASAYLSTGQYREAIDEYEALQTLRPQWAELQGRLGYAYLMAGDTERAVGAYQRTLELEPDSSLVRYQLARLHESRGDSVRALEEYQILIEKNPAQPEYHVRLADLQIALATGKEGELTQAEQALRLALSLDADFVPAHWSMGFLLARQERYQEALGLFERLLQLLPGDFLVHACLGNLYQRTGRAEEAQLHFERYERTKAERRLRRAAEEDMEKQVRRLFGQ